MFLRNDKEKVKTGRYELVQFCADCGSENIRLVCNKCGSHNIKHPAFADLISDDKRGMHEIIEEREVHIYKCDKCEKEFDGLKVPKMISLANGEFMIGKAEDDYGNYADHEYSIEEDLCMDCMKQLVNELNKELDLVAEKDNVNYVKEKLLRGEI